MREPLLAHRVVVDAIAHGLVSGVRETFAPHFGHIVAEVLMGFERSLHCVIAMLPPSPHCTGVVDPQSLCTYEGCRQGLSVQADCPGQITNWFTGEPTRHRLSRRIAQAGQRRFPHAAVNFPKASCATRAPKLNRGDMQIAQDGPADHRVPYTWNSRRRNLGIDYS
jgi:hypothetical protein